MRLTVIASYQPTHATSDVSFCYSIVLRGKGYAKRLVGRCGMQRNVLGKSVLRGLMLGRHTFSKRYQIRSVKCRLGGRVALGSDFPVESIDPLKGFFAAISRTNEKGESPHGPDGWYPEQKLSREQALRGFTIDGESYRL
jgi:predicted amidohydrolase YtcJ